MVSVGIAERYRGSAVLVLFLVGCSDPATPNPAPAPPAAEESTPSPSYVTRTRAGTVWLSQNVEPLIPTRVRRELTDHRRHFVPLVATFRLFPDLPPLALSLVYTGARDARTDAYIATGISVTVAKETPWAPLTDVETLNRGELASGPSDPGNCYISPSTGARLADGTLEGHDGRWNHIDNPDARKVDGINNGNYRRSYCLVASCHLYVVRGPRNRAEPAKFRVRVCGEGDAYHRELGRGGGPYRQLRAPEVLPAGPEQ